MQNHPVSDALPTPMWTRRALLGSLLVSGCARRRPIAAVPQYVRHLTPVYVSPDRVIRTVTGLRPFRPSGFVVRQEQIGTKTVIHNYGHGGGGMTLSWGTADLAVELALRTGQTQFAVLGCGGVGLATARLLQRRGASVTIYTKAFPPETTSNISGAQWWPVSVFDGDRLTPAFRDQFLDAAKRSYRHFQTMIGDRYGIRWLPNYFLSDTPQSENFTLNSLRELAPEYRDLTPAEHQFPAPYVRQFDTMLIEPPIYLAALLQDFQISGGKAQVRAFSNISELENLPEPALINCTGLGAKQLFSDPELIPIKGQLTVLLPQPEIQYNVLNGGNYMFPRHDGILLGGTHNRGDWTLEVDETAKSRVLEAHKSLFTRMRS